MAEAEQPVVSMSRDELEARVLQLEAEVERKDRALQRRERDAERRERSERRELTDSTRDTANRLIDETNKLVRGFTLAYVEGLRAAADAFGTFADEVSRRNPPDEEDTIRDLPGDLYSGYLKAVNQALRIPERAIDRLDETYRREDDSERKESRTERQRSR